MPYNPSVRWQCDWQGELLRPGLQRHNNKYGGNVGPGKRYFSEASREFHEIVGHTEAGDNDNCYNIFGQLYNRPQYGREVIMHIDKGDSLPDSVRHAEACLAGCDGLTIVRPTFGQMVGDPVTGKFWEKAPHKEWDKSKTKRF